MVCGYPQTDIRSKLRRTLNSETAINNSIDHTMPSPLDDVVCENRSFPTVYYALWSAEHEIANSAFYRHRSSVFSVRPTHYRTGGSVAS
jgi:hypothetical protein